MGRSGVGCFVQSDYIRRLPYAAWLDVRLLFPVGAITKDVGVWGSTLLASRDQQQGDVFIGVHSILTGVGGPVTMGWHTQVQ